MSLAVGRPIAAPNAISLSRRLSGHPGGPVRRAPGCGRRAGIQDANAGRAAKLAPRLGRFDVRRGAPDEIAGQPLRYVEGRGGST